jgi:hypothetical protein
MTTKTENNNKQKQKTKQQPKSKVGLASAQPFVALPLGATAQHKQNHIKARAWPKQHTTPTSAPH